VNGDIGSQTLDSNTLEADIAQTSGVTNRLVEDFEGATEGISEGVGKKKIYL
jgi:hypothetical protein